MNPLQLHAAATPVPRKPARRIVILRVETPPTFKVRVAEELYDLTLSETIDLSDRVNAALSLRRPNHCAIKRLREVVSSGVCEVFGVRPEELLQKNRGARRVAFARAVAMTMLREHCGEDGRPAFSLGEIGRAFNRDHGTVHHAVFTVAAAEEIYPNEKTLVQTVREFIANALQSP